MRYGHSIELLIVPIQLGFITHDAVKVETLFCRFLLTQTASQSQPKYRFPVRHERKFFATNQRHSDDPHAEKPLYTCFGVDPS